VTPADGGSTTERHWQYDVTDSTALLSTAYAFPSVLGGAIILGGVLSGWLVLTAILAGAIGRALAIAVGIVLLVLSRRWIVPAVATQTSTPLHERYSTRGLVLGSLVGAAVLSASTLLHLAGPLIVFLASLVPLILTAGFPTDGRVSPETTTLVVDGEGLPVTSISTYRTVSLGGLTVCWLSYARGQPTASRVIVVPNEAFTAVESVLEWGASQPVDTATSMSVAEKRVVVLFGLGLLAVGPTLWLLLPAGDGRIIALYGGVLFGLFGVVLLWHAAHG
jgi:hypothetical protein